MFCCSDDGYIAGAVEDVFRVVAALAERLKARCNVELQPAKSEAYSKSEVNPHCAGSKKVWCPKLFGGTLC